MKISGKSLAGGSGKFERIENDFYATDPNSTMALLDNVEIKGKSFYEPCIGKGHIAEVLKEYYPNSTISGSDLVDRGYPGTEIKDFLSDSIDLKVDWIITNPPYKYAKEFIDKSLKMVNNGVAMFLKIQFLEGQARKEWFKKNPPKYVYVFSKRQAPWRNGENINPNTGKCWANTMCFAWFIWEKGFIGSPKINWI